MGENSFFSPIWLFIKNKVEEKLQVQVSSQKKKKNYSHQCQKNKDGKKSSYFYSSILPSPSIFCNQTQKCGRNFTQVRAIHSQSKIVLFLLKQVRSIPQSHRRTPMQSFVHLLFLFPYQYGVATNSTIWLVPGEILVRSGSIFAISNSNFVWYLLFTCYGSFFTFIDEFVSFIV